MISAFEKRGYDPAPLRDFMLAQGVSADDLTARVPIVKVAMLWQRVTELANDDAIGLRLGSALAHGSRELFDYVGKTCDTFGELIRVSSRLTPLISEASIFSLHEREDGLEMVHRTPSGVIFPTPISDFVGARVLSTIRQLLQREVAPVRVSLTRPAPLRRKPWDDFYRCELRFGSASMSWLFPYTWLDEPLPSADPVLRSILLRQADEQLAALAQRMNFSGRVHDVVSSGLSRGQALSLEQAARYLGVSERTLRRRLAEEGSSYRDVIGACRERLARALLTREPQESIDRIAQRLGFSDPSTFHRAFKTWTGTTPAAYRSRHAGRLAPPQDS